MHVCDILSPENAFGGNKTFFSLDQNFTEYVNNKVAVWFQASQISRYATPAHTIPPLALD